MNYQAEQKILEAQEILNNLGLPEQQQNKLCALTLLALCNIKPEDKWENATQRSMTLTRHIMEFVNNEYDAGYKPNTRESFRKNALKQFVDYKLVDLNPDDPNLKQTSSNTHYAITSIALNTIKKFQTNDWNIAVENYRKYIYEARNSENNILIKTVQINNYKSIASENIELGQINVFIGANGSGKSNILEALAIVGAVRANDLNIDGLYSRGVRIARPDLMLSSFVNSDQESTIDIGLLVDDNGKLSDFRSSITPVDNRDIYTKWIDLAEEELYPEILLKYFKDISAKFPGISGQDLLDEANKLIEQKGLKQTRSIDSHLSDYGIFDLNTKTLRGIAGADSKKTPLGLNGEGLDVLIASFNSIEKGELYSRCATLVPWLSEIVTDRDEKLKISGLKPGKGTSMLYFRDKFLRKTNNVFSAENSNEGVLHILFYVSLFISNKTPRLFAIDNIETALNPGLCKVLISELAELARQSNKQVLVTTHNPSILDGLNLFDDNQRLFEVYRNDEGQTKTRRITFKSDLSDKPLKLSEMWTDGLLGAIPKNFF